MSTRCPPPAFEKKICTMEELPERAAALPKPVVFTNGVFDILHRGHVTYLAQARALGASLVVAVNSDRSVKMLGKGDDRPINTEADRAAVVAALESTDLVVVFPDKVPANPSQNLLDCQVRHLLMMADSHSDTTYRGPVDRDWIATYFNTPPSHLPGTVFSYNTASTVMLCAIVERVCGKTFLEYLKEKALLETGFSPDASCVQTPCGYAWGVRRMASAG